MSGITRRARSKSARDAQRQQEERLAVEFAASENWLRRLTRLLSELPPSVRVREVNETLLVELPTSRHTEAPPDPWLDEPLVPRAVLLAQIQAAGMSATPRRDVDRRRDVPDDLGAERNWQSRAADDNEPTSYLVGPNAISLDEQSVD